MNYLSISTIVRNEHLYLKEWVAFHLKQGVEHFYLYNNSEPGEPDQKEVVKEYEKYITWHDFPGHAKQRAACDHTIENYRNDTVWCAFMDVDEFLYCPSGLKNTLNVYDSVDRAGIAVHWLLFGSSGHTVFEYGDVTSRFTRRAERVNPHVKSIMKLERTICLGSNVHSFRHDGEVVDEKFNIMPEEYAVMHNGSADIFRMNHYVTKSLSECRVRRALPRSDTGEIRSDDFFEAHDRNEVEDKRILEFV